MKLTYGYTVHGQSDEYIAAAERAMDSFADLTTPGRFLVDSFPWRKSTTVQNTMTLMF
jgi:hypothetical protein